MVIIKGREHKKCTEIILIEASDTLLKAYEQYSNAAISGQEGEDSIKKASLINLRKLASKSTLRADVRLGELNHIATFSEVGSEALAEAAEVAEKEIQKREAYETEVEVPETPVLEAEVEVTEPGTPLVYAVKNIALDV